MTWIDWLVDVALIGVVVLQLVGRRLTARGLLVPVVLVSWAGAHYLDGIPTAGNDLVLIALAVALGAGLGVGAGVLTRVSRRDDGAVFARATAWAAVLWVLGMGIRLVFQFYATHGGAVAVARFSADHLLDARAWVTALVLMAFAEVFGRTAVVWLRGQGVRRAVRAGAA
ncbi:DUF1453 family protein [Saccharothrix syringae]|uniref:DUF1453 family protein n=1 Tax=Saccharothrix syringae TaxID=103733 RepID=A0A5Q0H4V8_SACSY|nr:DUF1453 family protein [Saccharothrix syringae]QFZ20915.1 DUF1453 family protein [Saccharothrix syringae]